MSFADQLRNDTKTVEKLMEECVKDALYTIKAECQYNASKGKKEAVLYYNSMRTGPIRPLDIEEPVSRKTQKEIKKELQEKIYRGIVAWGFKTPYVEVEEKRFGSTTRFEISAAVHW